MHRSEGLGLHCAEAMWLGKPVIATRYSGNVDFMDDTCAAMLDYQLVPVRYGQGIYPPEAVWAEPDTEQASVWMRSLASDPALCARLGASARERMSAQPSLADTGRTIARLANLRPQILGKGDI
jgi:glycosyltransferase involved in cell wall biosynthesis